MLYQAHIAFIWNGEYEAARGLVPRIAASQLPPVNLLYVDLRQASAEGENEAARRVMATLEAEHDSDVLWIPYHITGPLETIEDLLMPIHDSGPLFALSELLNYPYLDPNPYPGLMKLL